MKHTTFDADLARMNAARAWEAGRDKRRAYLVAAAIFLAVCTGMGLEAGFTAHNAARLEAGR